MHNNQPEWRDDIQSEEDYKRAYGNDASYKYLGESGYVYRAKGGRNVELGASGTWHYTDNKGSGGSKQSSTEKDVANSEPGGKEGGTGNEKPEGDSPLKKTADVTSTTFDFLERGADEGEKLAKSAAGAAVEGSEEALQLEGLAGQAGTLGKVFKGAGIVGTVITTGYSTYKVINQFNHGGVQEVVHHRDVLDAAVGATGLVSTGLATLGIISNPVGWGIGIGVLAYGVGTLIWDAVHEQ
jgi:hypothetical protein